MRATCPVSDGAADASVCPEEQRGPEFSDNMNFGRESGQNDEIERRNIPENEPLRGPANLLVRDETP
jgi:hypothetical protein